MSRAVQRFEEAARERGLRLDVRRFPAGTKTAPDAARAVGCEVGQIVKSLVFVADEEPVLALTSGANRADLAKLTAFTGANEVRRATAKEAREATGFAIGGTPPFGFPRPVRTLMDRDLFAFQEVWAAAGAPDSVFPIAPDELRRAAQAEAADFREGSP
jgi:prolyl-tRNA editing enzyme YbaK/EbsC (Cys-tRNA(Pro) deacylase)